jgi:cytochrome c-type biogenesis protein CcsB
MSSNEQQSNAARKTAAWGLGLMILALVFMASMMRMRDRDPSPTPSEFAQAVDLSPLSTVAVLSDGRLRSYPTHAHNLINFITGPREFNGQSHAFTLLDLMLRPQAYENANIIYVKAKPIRAQIASRLAARQDVTEEYLNTFMRTGRIAPSLLQQDPSVAELMQRLRGDAVKTAKHVEAIDSAIALRQPQVLAQNLQLIPPAGGDTGDHWDSILSVWGPPGSSGHDHLDAETSARLRDAWSRVVTAWTAQDAPASSEAIATFAGLLPGVAPDLYPNQSRLSWESWYADSGHMTWVWMVYLLSVVLLLLAVVYKWTFAQWAGMGVYVFAVALHTFAVMLRWYVAGRWPNSNMFEAVTTSAWFGAVGAIFFEVVARRTPMRNLFALGGAVTSMAALMSAHFMPVSLNPAIGNMMPILHDVWLYIHTNVVIFSYVLIAMAAVSALLYLLHRLAGGEADYARAGGAATLMAMGAASSGELAPKRAVTWAQVLDGVTMVLMEVAFVMLWAGIVMGAIWADHSWGRPWGWDPKEVFALNTFIIFVILIHVRLKVRDKGLWTAWLAVIGFISMLFNWIVINFIISGLHSYA